MGEQRHRSMCELDSTDHDLADVTSANSTSNIAPNVQEI